MKQPLFVVKTLVTLSELFTLVCERRDIGKAEAAQQMGIGYRTIINLKHARPSLTTYNALSDFCDIPVETLMTLPITNDDIFNLIDVLQDDETVQSSPLMDLGHGITLYDLKRDTNSDDQIFS